jgi:hypothetical protein
VQVPNSDHRLKPGAFAKASILLDRQANAVTVPEESLVRFAGVTKLFVVVDGRAVAVPVEPGVRLDVTDEAGVVRRWIEIPATGANAHDLKGPAPGLMLLPGEQSKHQK